MKIKKLAFNFCLQWMKWFYSAYHWSSCSFCPDKSGKIRTASPHATAPPRIFFLPALGCCPVILINRFVKNLFCVTVSKSTSGFPGKIRNRIVDNLDLVISQMENVLEYLFRAKPASNTDLSAQVRCFAAFSSVSVTLLRISNKRS